MRSLERRFNNIAKLNPFWSSYLCFAEAVKNQEFSKRIIAKHFNNLVDKNDYNKQEKKELLKSLLSLSKKDSEESAF